MKFTAFTIKNFKSIGEEGVTINFSPITLLFGANNSGKSTIIQALHLAHEVICNGNFSFESVSRGGRTIDLGSFPNYVHRHDINKEVSFRLDFEHTGDDGSPFLPDYEISGSISESQRLIYDYLLYGIKKTAIEIGLLCARDGKRAYISTYKIWHNESLFVQFKLYEQDYRAEYSRYENFPKIDAILDESASEDFTNLQERLAKSLPIQLDLHIPCWQNKVWSRGQFDEAGGAFGAEEFSFLNSVLSSLILGPGQLAKEQLCRFYYIGATRVTMPRLYDSGAIGDDDWAEGKAAWKWLVENKSVLENVNAELPRIFGDEFGMTIQPQVLFTMNPKRGSATAEDTGEPIPVATRAQFWNETLGVGVSPCDLGHGVSQVIPLITAPWALEPPPFLAIEEPEANIHPAWQVELAEFFLRMVKRLPEESADDGPPLIILETHSEHMMLRLLRRIRDTYDDALPEGATAATPEDVAVYYVLKDGAGCTEVLPIGIKDDAKFQKRWPKGFFGERGKELF